MTFANYTELRTTVIDWVADDTFTTSIATDCIALAEKELNRKLRTRNNEVNTTLSLASAASTITIPSGFVEFIAAQWQDFDLGPTKVTIEQLHALQTDLQGSAKPDFFAISKDNIEFERAADQAYNLEFRYWNGLDLATDSTNWVLTRHPDAYFNGAMHYAHDFLKDEEQAAKYWGKFQRAVDEALESEQRNRRVKARVDSALVARRQVWNIETDGQ